MQYTKSTQRKQLCFCTPITSEKEIKGIVLITRASKTVKFLEINISKEMTDLYTENYKTWMRGR